ncbi:HDOD domain family [Verrucomicrobiia bacterium DG1235]|nr:HDOD domain family [Verrucomicrobiae bacterium DG1235]
MTEAPFSTSEASCSFEWKSSIIACIEKFPTPASESGRLYSYLQGSHSALEGAIELVASDPYLAVEVIRNANLAEFGSRGMISVEDAVQTIGLERLARIALRIWLGNLLPSSLEAYGTSRVSFVRRSLGCGVAMRFLYQGDSQQSETAYAVGLLHAIGRVVIDEAVREVSKSCLVLQERTARRLAEAEFREFGLNHAEVGGLALKKWGFSKLVYDAVSAQFSANPKGDTLDWTQSLAICRYTTSCVMETLEDRPNPLMREGRVVYRGKTLSELYEYTLAAVEQEVLPARN